MRPPWEQRPGICWPTHVHPSGSSGLTPGRARGRGWRKVAKGYYVPCDIDRGARDQRIVEAATGLPNGAAVTGWAALAWVGAKWFNGLASDGATPLAVPVAVHDRRKVRPRAGVRVTEDWLFEDDLIEVQGLVITVPERSVSFEVRRARSLEDAVRCLDLAAAADQVSLDSLRRYGERLVARPGVRQLRAAIELADENVWSPMEPTLRLSWMAHRPGRLLCNVPIFDLHGDHIVTPDVFDPVAGVGGEYDGLVHVKDGVRRRDLNREERCRTHAIELVTMLNSDLGDHRDFHRRLDQAYARASRTQRPRTWTLEQPAWWVDTSTVARRRALSPMQRERWLRWQAA